ncbi:serine protease AprX [Pullulanibacillus camelliae]|uniref:Serine protease AprX n=1 Tax=Pullulanibacillus camelliae TaxID=1707096 RepID=A0A8J3DUL7_9BACL|nr:S8 family peptidase [Pullulanibacillus camelliae]GGE43663.1 serine protease AprX [Pullulanibacillus camelliae]
MFGYSMIQFVRSEAHRLDKPLREAIIHLYKPFKWTPCFLHQFFEASLKKYKKMTVVIEFKEGQHDQGCIEVNKTVQKHARNKIRKSFPRISCCTADVTPKGLENLLTNNDTIHKVYFNTEVHAMLDVAVNAAHAKNIKRNQTQLTGKGTTVAVVDTGIYPHEDLSGRIKDFVDLVNNKTTPYDDNGHGTHCAGDVASDGSASSGQYQGPAPEANLIGVKVLNKMGSGSLETIMQGIDWCITYNEEHADDPIDIISMSLGAPVQNYPNENADPMVKMVEKAWDAGIIVCVAAGNEGPDANTISSPGISDKIITVGALDDNNTVVRDDDIIASFSSRGPTPYGITKPDIVVPGVNIISLRSPNSYLDKTQKSSRIGTQYFSLSGTSMATPICAGIAALIKQQRPDASPDQVKEWIKNGADLWTDKAPNTYGAGYINAENSVPKN